MVTRFLLLLALTAPAGAARADSVDVARWAAGLPAAYVVHGTKAEPTWQETVDIVRDGDRVAVTGGAPGWAQRSTEVARVSAAGALCLGEATCRPVGGAGGFLASAGLVAAARRHQLSGRAPLLAFGDRQVVCLPGATVGIAEPVLDPCFDSETGAAVAQRHSPGDTFDGPTLDPASLTITIPPGAITAPYHEDSYP